MDARASGHTARFLPIALVTGLALSWTFLVPSALADTPSGEDVTATTQDEVALTVQDEAATTAQDAATTPDQDEASLTAQDTAATAAESETDDSLRAYAVSTLSIAGTSVVDGTNVTYWLNDGAGGITSTGANESDYNAKYDPSTNTLTLKGLSISKACSYMGMDDGICILGDLTIDVEGSNSVVMPDSTAPVSAGVYQKDGTLTFMGTGTFSATGGKMSQDRAYTCGIFTETLVLDGEVTVKGVGGDDSAVTGGTSCGATSSGTCTVEAGATLTGTGGSGYYSMGVGYYTAAKEMTLLVRGTVIGAGGTASGTYDGTDAIMCCGVGYSTVTVEDGGRLIGSGGISQGHGIGIDALSLTVDEGGYAEGCGAESQGDTMTPWEAAGINCSSMSVSGTAVATAGTCPDEGISLGVNAITVLVNQTGDLTATSTNTNAAAEYSFGINAGDTITMAGKVTATGGAAGTCSAGIDCGDAETSTQGTVNIQDGAVITAAGGACTTQSNGIDTNTAINISGGRLTATGETGALNRAPTITAASYGWKANTTTAAPDTDFVDGSVTPYVWEVTHDYLCIDRAPEPAATTTASATSTGSSSSASSLPATGDDGLPPVVTLAAMACGMMLVLLGRVGGLRRG